MRDEGEGETQKVKGARKRTDRRIGRGGDRDREAGSQKE